MYISTSYFPISMPVVLAKEILSVLTQVGLAILNFTSDFQYVVCGVRCKTSVIVHRKILKNEQHRQGAAAMNACFAMCTCLAVIPTQILSSSNSEGKHVYQPCQHNDQGWRGLVQQMYMMLSGYLQVPEKAETSDLVTRWTKPLAFTFIQAADPTVYHITIPTWAMFCYLHYLLIDRGR